MYVKNLQMLKTKECSNKTKEVASPHIGVLGERMREKKIKEVATATHIGVLRERMREKEEGARDSKKQRKSTSTPTTKKK